MDPSDGYMSCPIKKREGGPGRGVGAVFADGYYRIWAVNARGAAS